MKTREISPLPRPERNRTEGGGDRAREREIRSPSNTPQQRRREGPPRPGPQTPEKRDCLSVQSQQTGAATEGGQNRQHREIPLSLQSTSPREGRECRKPRRDTSLLPRRATTSRSARRPENERISRLTNTTTPRGGKETRLSPCNRRAYQTNNGARRAQQEQKISPPALRHVINGGGNARDQQRERYPSPNKQRPEGSERKERAIHLSNRTYTTEEEEKREA